MDLTNRAARPDLEGMAYIGESPEGSRGNE